MAIDMSKMRDRKRALENRNSGGKMALISGALKTGNR